MQTHLVETDELLNIRVIAEFAAQSILRGEFTHDRK